MKNFFNKIHQKFVIKDSFQLNTTLQDFNNHFRKYVDYNEISFFELPSYDKVESKYVGRLKKAGFIIKKSDNSFSPFQIIIKVNIEGKDKKLKLKYQINGFQGFNLLVVLISFLSITSFLVHIIFEKNYNQYGALYVYIPMVIFFYFIVYKLCIQNIIDEVQKIKLDFEKDVKNWFRV